MKTSSLWVTFWVTLLIMGCACISLLAQDPEDWEKIRSLAESRYELVLLKVEKGEFDEAVVTAKEIFALPFPADKHELLFDSAKEISDALIHHHQLTQALDVLDSCFHAVTTPELHAKLHKEMAYIYKKMGDDEKAMFHFEKAIELTKKP